MRARTVAVMFLLALLVRVVCGLWAGIAVLVDPFLVVTVLVAISGNPPRALITSVLGGALEDLWIGRWYGQFALAYLLIAFVLTKIGSLMDLMQPLATVVVLAAATAASWGLQLGFAAAFDRPMAQVPGPWTWVLSMVANVALGLFFRRVLRRLEDGKR